MKRHRVIVVLMLVIAAMLAVLWFWQKSEQPSPTPFAQTMPTPLPAASTTAPVPSPTSEPDYAKLKPKKELMREALSLLNHKDIEFYGKVVDQSGAPLGGAEVNGQVIYNSGVTSGVTKPKTVTDAGGLFSFKGMKGRTLDFNIVKPGYEFMPEGDAFDYTELVPEERRHHPDPRNPVLLKMWKLQGAEPLIHAGKTFEVPSNGTPVRIDLKTRKQVQAGGDLIITLNHEVWPQGTPHRPFNWNATIQVIDGGLVEDKSRIMNMAPEDGYSPELAFGEHADQLPQLGGVDTKCYLRLPGNVFGKMTIHIGPSPGSPPSLVDLGWWLNPKPGSRNLEYDPTKKVALSR